jgi:catechol 2,3-dioxygenase-like lactoylglutathione lyase family enzyme
MELTCIDHAIVAVPDLESAAEPWHRLGLTPTFGTRHRGGTENAVIFVGGPESMFYIEFLTVNDRAAAAATSRHSKLIEAVDSGPGLFRLMLATSSIARASAALATHGVDHELAEVHREDGDKICDVLTLHGDSETSSDPRLVEYVTARPALYEARRARGLFAHTFEMARLDHVALLPADLAAATEFWTGVLGVPVAGEVTGSGILVRQLRVGDAMVELLAASGPGSRLAGAEPGLRSMLAFEVDDLDLAVDTARERGFVPTEPAKGILPGTRAATIPPDQLSGVALQLLEYL